MKPTTCKASLAGILAVVGLMVSAGGQELKDQTVKAVNIQGLSRISEQLVRSKIEVQPGQAYNPRAVSRDIRRLDELGYFATVKADAKLEGGQVVLAYLVEEKRVIEEVKIVGNDKIRSRAIRGVLKWKEGDSFVPEGYDEERVTILKLYESKGFPNARVDIRVEETAPSRLRIVYTIAEGKKARIRSIHFEGNETLSDRKLKKVMKTKRAWWFLGGKYDPVLFEADLQNIVNEYGNYGRLEAEIADTPFVYSENGKRVDVTIRLQEGPVYHTESVEIANNSVFDDDELLRGVKVQSGDVHNKGQVESDAAAIQTLYRDSGYINDKATPQVTLDRDKKTTHVVYQVEEGNLKYVREIKVTGNAVTRDDVVRREIMLTPGERFDGTLIEESQRRLENTEYFEKVRLNLEDIEGSDEFSNLLANVEEGKTGTFNFGGGYSTEEGFGGFTEVNLNNFDIANWPTFSGGGQQLRAKLKLGERRTQYNLGFTNPEFLGYPLAFGVDVFSESYKYKDSVEYTEDSTGGQLRFAKVLSPYVTARTGLLYRNTEISDLPGYKAPNLKRLEGGPTTVSSIWGIERDTRDIKRDPTTGAIHDVQFELAGLGGDNDFYRLTHDSSWYWALDKDKKWILSFRTREGWANEYGASEFVPLADRFFAGGTSTVRGYESRDIGPTEQRWFIFGEEDRVGGNLRLVNNLEVKYKLTKQFRLYGFLDSGTVWSSISDFGPGDIKYGAGIGFGVDIPRMGPIRVDYGFPLNPEKDQGRGQLHLQTGLRF